MGVTIDLDIQKTSIPPTTMIRWLSLSAYIGGIGMQVPLPRVGQEL